MGYYTNYSLTIQKGEYDTCSICKKIYADYKDDDDFYPLMSKVEYILQQEYKGEWQEFEFYFECKWYNHEFALTELSKLFPCVVFKLHGEGEESDDLWNKYFKNGKKKECYAEIKIAPYNDNFFE